MEENKYYTPEIEELYVGFEFEFETGIEGWKKFTVKKEKIEAVLSNLTEFKTQFRVKYLDKEDIESLGWLANKYNSFNIGDWCLSGQIQYQNIEIEKEHSYMVMGEHQSWTEKHFDGKIKNKSELKKLMQQLNIITN